MSDSKYTNNSPLLMIVGPTGSGKTGVAIEMCDLLNGEIVSADSMQIYCGLDIGTGKATPQEQERAPHHLIDIRSPDQEYSAAQWAADAERAIEEIRARGKIPVVCGGTGFYIRALLQPSHLASAPPNPTLRAALEHRARTDGNFALHEYLQTLDAQAAQRLHVNDRVRVIRAIEVALATANSESTLEPDRPTEYLAFGFDWPREALYERIEKRIDQMLADGFLEELRRLIESGYGDTAPLQSLGYKQMRPVLKEAAHFDECLELWKRDTRRYAKRQLTWFRHQLQVQWFVADGKRTLDFAHAVSECYSKE